MFRKALSLLCALVLLCLPCAQAETVTETSESFLQFYRIPQTVTYQGGMVLQGYLKGADTSLPDLDVAYMLTSMPYIVLGQPTTWEVAISGGSGDYSCEVLLAYQDFSLDPFKNQWDVPDWFSLDGNTFDYTFTKPGRYFWEFRVIDEGGRFITFQTRIYETFTEDDETDVTTTAGKANWVVDQVITPDMSDYDRALALHDWLIYNANYDYSDAPYRDASGVLVHGTGVCDSYARAYLMLCTIAGLDCIYVSGDAYSGGAWGAHGWNMVKLNGEWYHVDCTWDDPGTGGSERHKYFCIDDETMEKDHRWNRPDNIYDSGYLPPASEDGDLENDPVAGSTYHFTFSTMEEFNTNLEAMIAAGDLQVVIFAKYTGTENHTDFYYSDYRDWVYEKTDELYSRGLLDSAGYLGISDGLFYVTLYWKDAISTIRINESSMSITAGNEGTIIPAQYYPEANVFTWTSSDPSVATVSASYTEETGLVATVVAVSGGKTTITATSPDGYSDSIELSVLPAFKPDFGFNAATDSEGVTLSWESIPGVTEYRVYRREPGSATVFVRSGESLLATTTATRIYLSKAQLPNDVEHELYIEGVRVVAGEEVFSYMSTAISYGRVTLTYASTLPPSLTVIDDRAFENCVFLTSVKLPAKLTRIGDSAFAGCTRLTTVRIPASVTYIGEDAFEGCPLQYAEVSPGSYAEEWLLLHFPGIRLVY